MAELELLVRGLATQLADAELDVQVVEAAAGAQRLSRMASEDLREVRNPISSMVNAAAKAATATMYLICARNVC